MPHHKRHLRERPVFAAVAEARRDSGTHSTIGSCASTVQTSGQCAGRQKARLPGTSWGGTRRFDRVNPARQSIEEAPPLKSGDAAVGTRDCRRQAAAESFSLPSNSDRADRVSAHRSRFCRPAGRAIGSDRMRTHCDVPESKGAIGRRRKRPGHSCSIAYSFRDSPKKAPATRRHRNPFGALMLTSTYGT